MLMVSFNNSVQAEIQADSFSFTPFIGGYFFEGNQNDKNAVTFGARAGYNFTKHWGAEGFLTYAPTDFQDTNTRNNVYVAGIEGLYYFFPDGRFVPFVAVGAGAFHYSDNRTGLVPTNFAADYGIGAKLYLNDYIALRADVRHVMPFNDRYNDLLATIGINFDFFPAKKQTVENKTDELSAPAPTAAETKPAEPPAPAPPVVAETKPAEPPSPPPRFAESNDLAPDTAKKGAGTPPAVAENKPVPVWQKFSILLNVEFDKNKAVVKKQYHNHLKTVGVFMKAHPESRTLIAGYTDDFEMHKNWKKNMHLSKVRADNVREYLVKKFHIDASRIATIGYGSKHPVASSATEKGRKKNRRVEAVIRILK